MATPFIGEIKTFGFNFAPRNYAFCDGRSLNIAQNTALFSLIGTSYGGNGTTTFRIPDLRGRVSNHQGSGPGLTPYTLGEQSGAETVSLLVANLPAHTHTLRADSVISSAASGSSPSSTFLANSARTSRYVTGTANSALNGTAIVSQGSGVAHENMQPYLALNYCIALTGAFPSRS